MSDDLNRFKSDELLKALKEIQDKIDESERASTSGASTQVIYMSESQAKIAVLEGRVAALMDRIKAIETVNNTIIAILLDNKKTIASEAEKVRTTSRPSLEQAYLDASSKIPG